jgi:hypothetical protein
MMTQPEYRPRERASARDRNQQDGYLGENAPLSHVACALDVFEAGLRVLREVEQPADETRADLLFLLAFVSAVSLSAELAADEGLRRTAELARTAVACWFDLQSVARPVSLTGGEPCAP